MLQCWIPVRGMYRVTADEKQEKYVKYEEYAALEARVKELDAEMEEQDSIVIGAWPIVCRNNNTHERYDGCLYCLVRELEAERDKLKADVARLVEAAQQVIEEHADTPLNQYTVVDALEEALAAFKEDEDA